jgi:endonuclease/exonuclease/phosphatase family metal-dependent hydrolase
VNTELKRFAGNFIARKVKLSSGLRLRTINVYSSGWQLARERLAGFDLARVRLKQSHDVWNADLLWAALSRMRPQASVPWIIGGDFNLCETRDFGPAGPRGNREYLDRMERLGLTDCLRFAQNALTPTYRMPGKTKLTHQQDYLFVTDVVQSALQSCNVGQHVRVIDEGLSDHLPIIADFDDEALMKAYPPIPL